MGAAENFWVILSIYPIHTRHSSIYTIHTRHSLMLHWHLSCLPSRSWLQGKWDGNGKAIAAVSADVASKPTKNSTAASSAAYWWKFDAADCSGDDVPGDCPGTLDHVACCSGDTLDGCKAKCANTTDCGGFNYPHGILKKKTCLQKKNRAESSTLYVLSDKPQPPSPAPPAPPQWEGSWSLDDRYNRFLCHLRNYGVVSPPQMPCDCRLY
jgi:hypothetical protein